ncbi:MAG: hypothetical protein ACPL6D_11850, partial [Thermodesulfobacteriota bacterium]
MKVKLGKIKWRHLIIGTLGVAFGLILIEPFQPIFPEERDSSEKIIQAIQIFRKEKDHFFKTAPNSPLE